ncbi:dUTPase domain-containing protein [Haematococcus lacustris]|uniref:Deoxyuridine 5'-triphosphate nucleotidohydrolase n=1 Tax=Haematococcus lacustris TaxID=44745 RepID=A0A699ZY76_HAELA|nr:dUTPase domain-containing protein [Haematococcus lacustris]
MSHLPAKGLTAAPPRQACEGDGGPDPADLQRFNINEDCPAFKGLLNAHDCVIPARGKELVKTDISIKLPRGTYGRVAPRSGLAVKKFIDTGAGVIDEDYRGPVGVLLFNHSDQDFADVLEVDDLDETLRGAGGFGSTGIAAVRESAPVC